MASTAEKHTIEPETGRTNEDKRKEVLPGLEDDLAVGDLEEDWQAVYGVKSVGCH